MHVLGSASAAGSAVCMPWPSTALLGSVQLLKGLSDSGACPLGSPSDVACVQGAATAKLQC